MTKASYIATAATAAFLAYASCSNPGEKKPEIYAYDNISIDQKALKLATDYVQKQYHLKNPVQPDSVRLLVKNPDDVPFYLWMFKLPDSANYIPVYSSSKANTVIEGNQRATDVYQVDTSKIK
jgi:hypothetical protein